VGRDITRRQREDLWTFIQELNIPIVEESQIPETHDPLTEPVEIQAEADIVRSLWHERSLKRSSGKSHTSINQLAWIDVKSRSEIARSTERFA
jgi:hypothetical protein